MFAGFVSLGSTLAIPVLFTDSSSVPKNSSVTPSYRVYGNAGLQPNGTGSLSVLDTGSITGATNATPIVITSANHGLTTGTVVTIAGVGGNTAANGTFTVTRINANTFSLQSSVGNSGYTTGGTWNVTGLYVASITPTQGDAYAQGGYYDVLISATISGNQIEQQYRFGVI